MEIIPTKNNCFIEIGYESDIESAEETTDGGIILPTGKEKDYIMTVTYAGPNEIGVTDGTKVLINPNASLLQIRIGKRYFNLLPISMVLAVIKDEDK